MLNTKHLYELYTYVCVCVCVYIYIYIERERERENHFAIHQKLKQYYKSTIHTQEQKNKHIRFNCS